MHPLPLFLCTKVFPPVASFMIFLCLWLLPFILICPDVIFYHLSCLVFSPEFPESVIQCLTLVQGKFPVVILSKISSFIFSSLSASPAYHTSCSALKVFECSVQFFPICFSGAELSTVIALRLVTVSSVISSIPMSLPKPFFIYFTRFLVSNIYIWLFLRISNSLFILFICFNTLSTLSIKIFRMLITIILNS